VVANCITVKAEVASSTRRRFFMMIEVPGKVLAAKEIFNTRMGQVNGSSASR
jgi:hypothetical protein